MARSEHGDHRPGEGTRDAVIWATTAAAVAVHAGRHKRRRRAFWRDHAAFVLQDYGIMDEESVAFNVTMAASLFRSRVKGDRARMPAALEQTGLVDRDDEDAVHLSGGEKQRLAVARAIYKDAGAVFVDARIDAADAQTAEVLAGHPIAEIVQSMPGMGPILSAESLAHAGKPGTPTTPSRLAARAGFAPVNRDSGSVSGNLKRPHRFPRKLRRFPRKLRRAFLMSALGTAAVSSPGDVDQAVRCAHRGRPVTPSVILP